MTAAGRFGVRAALIAGALLLASPSLAAPPTASASGVHIQHDERGFKLQVDGRDFFLFGMNWSYTPIGNNYAYSLWTQPDWMIKEALSREMGLLRAMGVNTIRQYADIPPRWVEYIHANYGIYTVINPLLGRYGLDVDGVWVAHIDYGAPSHRRAILADLARTIGRYRNTPGVLMWMLGNENNYGLEWTSFEIGNLPVNSNDARADSLYSLFGEAVRLVKSHDPAHPVTLANGDANYLDLIAKHCQGLDAFGANVYRGPSARDLFDKVQEKLQLPVLFTEFGADAFNARTGHEAPAEQAELVLSQWREIYEQSYGKGRAGNAIGGFQFQWTDGWWKFGQDKNLDLHDTTASWAADAYAFDYERGENNMNEEWFGITALGTPDAAGLYHVRPRTAYYVLQAAFRLDPYAPDTTPARIRAHFDSIHPSDFGSRYDASEALAKVNALGWLRVANLRLIFDGSLTKGDAQTVRGDKSVFDHTESFYLDFVLQPTANVYARLSLNIVGNAAQNRLDPIYYENRTRVAASPIGAAVAGGKGTAATPGMTATAGSAAAGTAGTTAGGTTTTAQPMTDLQRLAVYQAEFNIEQRWFSIEGFYRTGHYHWGDEGDLFGLYRNAYYGPNLDIYNGNAPFGAVVTMHHALEGLKIAIGPELFWGANPSLIAKYTRSFGPVTMTLMHQEDLASGSGAQTSSVIREPPTRRTAVGFELRARRILLQAGGIFAGSTKVDQPFLRVRRSAGRGYVDSGYDVLSDRIQWGDTFGGKLKLTLDLGRVRWFAQAQLRGLVADGGPDSVITLTDFSMRESGRGNHVGGESGAVVDISPVQIGAKVLYQRPLVGPNPLINDYFSPQTGLYYPAVRPRNILSDPFAVRDNRETLGFEMLLVFDPTPATWYWSWDRELREDAPFAASIDAVYRMQPTSLDSGIAILANGALAPFNAAPPAHDVWDATFRFVANAPHAVRLTGAAWAGQLQSTGASPRLVTRVGGEARLWWKSWLLWTVLKLNDWGPYDYQRDFNLTFPLQWYGDLSYRITAPLPHWLGTRIGLRGQVRTLDANSENFVPKVGYPQAVGWEYEIGAYTQLSL